MFVIVIHGVSGRRCCHRSNGCMGVVRMCYCKCSNRRGFNCNK